MGRWAQAARRGGGSDRPRTAFPYNLTADQQGGFWVPQWSSTTDPAFWRVSVQRFNGSSYVVWADYVVNGNERQAVTTLPEGDDGRYKMRSEGNGIYSEFTDWYTLSPA